MTITVQYKGTYTDHSGTTAITMTNDFKTLSCEIDAVKFEGSEFSDLALIDKAKYTDAQLERFSYYSWQNSTTGFIVEELCECSFSVIVPQIIFDKGKGVELYIDLKIGYLLGKQRPNPVGGLDNEIVKLSLTIDERNFEGTSSYMENGLNEINKQFDNKYQFKNCYGCMFGDYSVYGQSSFGTMLCFVRQREDYLQVKSKTDYIQLSDDYDIVQEIYCCDRYEIRKEGVGYRG